MREVNQNPVAKPGLKQKLVVMYVLGPTIASEAISQHQILNFLGGSMPPDPPSFCIHANVLTRGTCTDKPDQCNFASTGPEYV